MKKLIVVLVAASFAAPLMANRIVEKANFRDDYIRMASGWPKCGAVSLQMKPSKRKEGVIVEVRASKWAMSLLGGNTQMKHQGNTSEWTRVPTEGMRIAFDHSGDQPSSHWRIYCQQKATTLDLGVPVSCKAVLDLKDSVNQETCWFGLLSPLSVDNFEPLNMKAGADIIKD